MNDVTGDCRVFICDDQAEIRLALSEVLASLPGFQKVGESADGEGCLKDLGASRPDLLILDVNLPQGGAGLARAARVLVPDLLIVAFTAMTSPETRSAMLHAGVDYYVVKTGRLQPLTDALRSAAADSAGRHAAGRDATSA